MCKRVSWWLFFPFLKVCNLPFFPSLGGKKEGKDTLYQYFTYLEDAYALFSVPIFRNSVQEEQRKPRKIYAIDNGFKTLLNTSLSSDFSKLYENLVFLQLRRHHREVYYYKEVQEVDFYVPGAQARLVNVSVDIEGTKTYDREINGLLEAMKYMKLDRAELVTQHRHEQIEIEGKRIESFPYGDGCFQSLKVTSGIKPMNC